MKIRNFTGKTLRIINEKTGEEKVLEAEGKAHFEDTYGPETIVDGVPVVGEKVATLVDLPDKEEDTFIVVPWNIRSATNELWERDDLLTASIANSEETPTEIICNFLEKR